MLIDPLIVQRPLLFAVTIISTIVIDAIISLSMFYCYMLERAQVNIINDFDLVTLVEEVKTATLLDVDFSGPTTMHADRGVMFCILLNLGRNAGAAGATKLTIEIWWAGHLAIFDISDNDSDIPRHHPCPQLPLVTIQKTASWD